jgi:hypothetical protein
VAELILPTPDKVALTSGDHTPDHNLIVQAIIDLNNAKSDVGGAYVMATWKYSTSTTAPPAAGYIRTNNADPALATTLWIHEIDDEGIDRAVGMANIVATDKILLRSADFQADWTVVTNTDSGAYRTLTVTLDRSLGTDPGNNKACQIYAVLQEFSTAPGGTGTPEIHVGPDAPTGDELVWYDTDENSIASSIISGDTAPESHDVLWLDTTEEAPATTLAPFLLMGS